MARKKTDELERAIENAIEPDSFIGYRQSWSFVSDLEDVAGRIGKLVGSGQAERAVGLYETFIAACHEKAEEIDDSSGSFGTFVEDLFCAWIEARQAAGADVEETAETLVSWMEDDPYGFCYGLERDAVKAFRKRGLEAFGKVVRSRLEIGAAETGEDAGAKGSPDAELALRQWGDVLRAIYAQQRDIEAYVAICEQTELTPNDCEVIAGILKRRRKQEEALSWVERGIELQSTRRHWNRGGSYKLPEMKRELLRKLGRANEALDSAWADFQSHPSSHTYKTLMGYAPRAERDDWHLRAMKAAAAAPLSSLIELWLDTKETDRLVRRLGRASNDELEALSHYATEPAAKRLAKPHPAVAAKVLRALGMRILAAKKSKYYDAALAHFRDARKCYARAGIEDEWLSVVEEVRRRHGRKYSFMPGFEEIVEGRSRETEPSFLERARSRWPRGGRR